MKTMLESSVGGWDDLRLVLAQERQICLTVCLERH